MTSSSELVSRYLLEKAPVWAEGTLQRERKALALYVRFAPEISRERVTAFALDLPQRMKAKGERRAWSLSFLHLVLASLKRFLHWAFLRGLVLEDLSLLITLPRFECLPRALPPADLQALLSADDLRLRTIVEVLYGTGLRAGELVRLKVEDVDLESGLVFVREGKGKKDRVVPFGEHLAEVLIKYLEARRPTVYLFETRPGRPLSRSTLNLIVGEGARRLGVKASPHRVRHSYATDLLRNGAPVGAIQALLGHSSLASTEIYLGVEVSDLKRMIEWSHPRERGGKLQKHVRGFGGFSGRGKTDIFTIPHK